MSPARTSRKRNVDRASARPRLRYSRIPILHGADLTTRQLALMESKSGKAGPCVWLTAGIHGDEVGGIVVVQEIFARLRKRPLVAGRLCGFPLLNPFGFETASRRIPATQEDLNRAFPGDAQGSLAQRISHLVSGKIRESSPDLVLDLHNDWIRSIPYVLIDPRPSSREGREAYTHAHAAARAMGLPIVTEPSDADARRASRSTLSGHLLDSGVPALTVELGAAGTVEESSVQAATELVWAVLVDQGMVSDEPGAAAATRVRTGRARTFRYDHRPCPSTAGIIRFRVMPGSHVSKGTALASIHDVFGRRVELLRAEADSLVLGFSDSSLAVPGLPIIALAQHDASGLPEAKSSG